MFSTETWYFLYTRLLSLWQSNHTFFIGDVKKATRPSRLTPFARGSIT